MAPPPRPLLLCALAALCWAGGLAYSPGRRGHAAVRGRSPRTAPPSGALAAAAVAPEGAAAAVAAPQLFFLFLTKAGVQRGDLWQAFFQGAPSGSYHVFVHCMTQSLCDSTPLKATQVQTVRTVYCDDLVSAMVQLLKESMLQSFSTRDKFAFVSESTLPVKPFALVYDTLTADELSDFCVSPDNHWLALQSGPTRTYLLAHSQWVTLCRGHAARMVQQWPLVKGGFNGTDFAVGVSGTGIGRTRLPGDVPMCTDEWAIFATIYGLVKDSGQQAVRDLPGFGRPLFLHGPRAASSFQGPCYTFASWGHNSFPSDKVDLISGLLRDSPHTELSCRGIYFDGRRLVTSVPRLPCNDTHPAEITALSDQGAQVLRRSHYLFVRKFGPKVVDIRQFKRFILDSGPS